MINDSIKIERSWTGSRAKPGPVDQPAEQLEVGIRRDHDIEPPSGLQTLARLVEQRCDVAIMRAGMPAAIGEVARLARHAWAGSTGSRRTAAAAPAPRAGCEHSAPTRSPKPLARAFSAAVSAAFGLMSAAMTLAAPARAAASARMPDPVPTSRTRLPRQVETADEFGKALAAEEIARMKHRRAARVRRKPAARVTRVRRRPGSDDRKRSGWNGAARGGTGRAG